MKRTIIAWAIGAGILSAAVSTSMAQARAVKAAKEKITLPQVVGQVRKLSLVRFVPNAPASWIVHGDKRFSLCSPKGAGRIACAPIASRQVMAGVKVSFVRVRGYDFVHFKPDRRSTLDRAQVAGRAVYFVNRLRRHRLALDRTTVPWKKTVAAAAIEGGGTWCTYNEGDYWCEAGAGNNGGAVRGGGAGDDYPVDSDNGDGHGEGWPSEPTSRSDSAQKDGEYPSFTGIIPFRLPEGCIATPLGLACSITGNNERQPGAIPGLDTPPAYPATRFTWPDWSNWRPRNAWRWCLTFRAFCADEPESPPGSNR